MIQRNQKNRKALPKRYAKILSIKNSHELSSYDINLANPIDFQFLDGVIVTLAKRIVKYRSKLRGFSFENQLYEVFNILAPIVQKS